MSEQPNFLILMADQLSGTLFDAAGPAEFLHTPVLRSLAGRAVQFARAYCPSPLCTPSRASFMSGRLPSASGVYDNAAEFPASLPTFAHHLRILGYQTILSGKMHFVGPDQLHGFEQRLTTDIYPADFGWTPDWRNPEQRIDWWYHNLSSVREAGVAATTNQLEFDDDTAYHAKLKLYQLARKGHQQPFCLTVSFTHPHDPYVARRNYWDLYPESKLPPLNVAAIPYEQQDRHSQRLLHAVDYTRFELSEQHITNARRAYFANISYLDECIGGILQVLQDCGFADNTVILLCADHGDMLGERGLWFKMNFFENSIRVPLWLHAPQRFAARAVAEPVSTLDVLATLVDMAGGSSDGEYVQTDGRSLLPLAAGDASLQRPIFAEYAAEGSVDPMIMIRDGVWKFNYCEADPPQLFNLQDDPHELDNLAADSTYADLVSRFLEQLQTHWDIGRFRDDVRLSQARRLLVYDALRRGEYQSWDYQPLQRASERYMRNHLDLNVLEATARYPAAQD
jgi:choline-sulfatase